jgi:hypothetical protein
MRAHAILFLAAIVASSSVTKNTVEIDMHGMPLTPPLPESITVRTSQNGLPWPLSDTTSSDGIMIHALHCYQVASSPLSPAVVNVTNSGLQHKMTQMHHEHCKSHRNLVEAYLKTTPLKMPLQTCQILLPSSAMFGKQHHNLEALLGDSCCAPWSEDIFSSNSGAVKQALDLPTGALELTQSLAMTSQNRA